MHYTLKSGDAGSCKVPADQTIEVKDSTGDGGTQADAGSSCTTTTDTNACTSTISCSTDANGYTTTTEITIDSKNLKGSSANKTVKDSDMSVLYDCAFDFTYTKQ